MPASVGFFWRGLSELTHYYIHHFNPKSKYGLRLKMPDSEDDIEGEGLDPSEYVMPVVPPELGLDPLLVAVLHCAAFLDFAEEALVEPDAAGDTLEHVGLYMQRLPAEQLARIESDLDRLAAHAQAAGWPEPMIEFVGDFLYSCGIGEERDDGAAS